MDIMLNRLLGMTSCRSIVTIVETKGNVTVTTTGRCDEIIPIFKEKNYKVDGTDVVRDELNGAVMKIRVS